MKKLSLIVIGIISLPFSAFADKLNAVECSKLSDMIERYSQQVSVKSSSSGAARLMPSNSRRQFSYYSDEELKLHGMTDEQIAAGKRETEKYQTKEMHREEWEIAKEKAEAELRKEEEQKWELERAAEERAWQEKHKKLEARLKKQKIDLEKAFKNSDCADHFKNLNALPVMQEIKADRLKWEQEE